MEILAKIRNNSNNENFRQKTFNPETRTKQLRKGSLAN